MYIATLCGSHFFVESQVEQAELQHISNVPSTSVVVIEFKIRGQPEGALSPQPHSLLHYSPGYGKMLDIRVEYSLR